MQLQGEQTQLWSGRSIDTASYIANSNRQQATILLVSASSRTCFCITSQPPLHYQYWWKMTTATQSEAVIQLPRQASRYTLVSSWSHLIRKSHNFRMRSMCDRLRRLNSRNCDPPTHSSLVYSELHTPVWRRSSWSGLAVELTCMRPFTVATITHPA